MLFSKFFSNIQVTGNGNFFKLIKNYFSHKNLIIYIWFYATKNRAGPWI